MSGSAGSRRSPSITWSSGRQTPQTETRTRTWPTAGAGSGSSFSMSGAPSSGSTIARIVRRSVDVDRTVESAPDAPSRARPGLFVLHGRGSRSDGKDGSEQMSLRDVLQTFAASEAFERLLLSRDRPVVARAEGADALVVAALATA